ncbi:Predicted membrane protein [Microbacterium sp. C448]|uniref:hypothetical protein n=1 Tax=Microbacterium sp. C448 TaxID=1177594 RepID=UPI0003DE4708|nr:hypothetical protein [Microbacterium sp. C448]CDK01693.1 Predicted membrane protein [Microbacterium sp. C448]
MSAPELAPRSSVGGIAAIWIAALLGGVAVAIFVPAAYQAQWFVLALAASLLLSFGVQLAYGRSTGFIRRVAASVLGALVALGVVSVAVGVATIIPG